MKKNLYQAAPKPHVSFVRRLERQLLARMDVKETSYSLNFNTMKRWSLTSLSGLLLVAFAVGLFYPFGSSAEQFIADAQDYYDEYEIDGIFYQKSVITANIPTHGDDPNSLDYENSIHYSYEKETWRYGDYFLILSTPLTGDPTEMYGESSLSFKDEYGNDYLYMKTDHYSGVSLNEGAPYCLVQVTSPSGSQTAKHIFEASPEALEAYETVYLPENSIYPFTIIGGVMEETGIYLDHAYAHDFPLSDSEAVALVPEGVTAEEMAVTEAFEAFEMAEASPENAKTFFDLLDQGEEYTHHTETGENGETLHVFTLPTIPVFVDDQGEAVGDDYFYEEFVFDENYALRQFRAYQGGHLTSQVEYLETQVIDESQAEAIFAPEPYDFQLVFFSHSWEIVDTPLVDQGISGNKACFSFENELLSPEETEALLSEYAVLVENIELLGMAELNREEQAEELDKAYDKWIFGYLYQGLVEEAYLAASSQFQSTVPYEDFAKMVDPELFQDNPTLQLEILHSPERGLGDFALSLTDPNGNTLLYVGQFVQEDEQWKLNLLLEGEEAQQQLTDWGYDYWFVGSH